MPNTSDSIPLKRCSKGDNCLHPMGCMQPATTDYFHRRTGSKDGLYAQCKECNNKTQRGHNSKRRDKRCEYQKKYRQKYPDRTRETERRSRAKNPEHYRALARKNYLINLEDRKEYARQWYWANPEKRNEAARRWRQTNPERARENQRKWRAANPDKIKRNQYANHRRWQIKHPETVRAIAQRRRARKRALPATFTVEQWQECLNWWHGVCAYCGAQQTFWNVITQDHLKSITDGGGYTRDNIVPACTPCNSSKHNKPVREWLATWCSKSQVKKKLDRIQEYIEWAKSQE